MFRYLFFKFLIIPLYKKTFTNSFIIIFCMKNVMAHLFLMTRTHRWVIWSWWRKIFSIVGSSSSIALKQNFHSTMTSALSLASYLDTCCVIVALKNGEKVSFSCSYHCDISSCYHPSNHWLSQKTYLIDDHKEMVIFRGYMRDEKCWRLYDCDA